MAILSIQSRVTSGYVGNAAAVPLLQRLGHTVWPIDTVTFSNHPAHGTHSGGARPASEIDTLVSGLHRQNLLASCDIVLSGYLGTADTGPAVLAAADQVRQENPAALWCCDPVMGDHGQFYVADGIPAFFRDHALCAADMILPNAFEAAFLSGISVQTVEDALRAAHILRDRGPRTVIISGVAEDGLIGAVAADTAGSWKCMAPLIEAPAYGAGDAFTALIVSAFLDRNSTADALGFAVAGVQAVLRATAAAGTADLDLIAALPALDALTPCAVQPIV